MLLTPDSGVLRYVTKRLAAAGKPRAHVKAAKAPPPLPWAKQLSFDWVRCHRTRKTSGDVAWPSRPTARPPDVIIRTDCRVSRVGPTHRRAFRVASGPIVATSPFMLEHLFASERPSPSARERVRPKLRSVGLGTS
jgi:hypothetical protein